MIDDVDRLLKSEISELLQLVKANADFPNVIYLVLAERRTIENSLADVVPGLGREFLHKIFQVQFDVPLPHSSRLVNIFANNLNELLLPYGELSRPEINRWLNLLVDGLQHYLKTLRDINRFLATLEFHVGLFALPRGRVLEVNQVDLIGVEAIRMWEPGLYERLPGLKDELLTDPSAPLSRRSIESDRQKLQHALSLASDEGRPHAEHVLLELFPRIANTLRHRNILFNDSEAWVRDRRICSEEHFDRYFAFALRDDELSEAELQIVITQLRDRAALKKHFEELDRRGLFRALLGRLDAYKTTLPLDGVVTFCAALMDQADTMPKEPGSFGMDGGSRTTHIIHWYLLQEHDIERRERLLCDILRLTTGVLIPMNIGSYHLDHAARRSNPDAYLLPEDRVGGLVKECKRIIAAAASADRLEKQPLLARILFYWIRIENESVVRGWVAERIAREAGALLLLRAFVHIVRSRIAGERMPRDKATIYVKELEGVVDLEVLAAAVDRMRARVQKDEDREALKAWDYARDRQTRGLSDNLRIERDEDEND